MIFTNQALALFPPSLGQGIAQTQRDRDELVEEICCRIGRPPVLLTQENVYPACFSDNKKTRIALQCDSRVTQHKVCQL